MSSNNFIKVEHEYEETKELSFGSSVSHTKYFNKIYKVDFDPFDHDKTINYIKKVLNIEVIDKINLVLYDEKQYRNKYVFDKESLEYAKSIGIKTPLIEISFLKKKIIDDSETSNKSKWFDFY